MTRVWKWIAGIGTAIVALAATLVAIRWARRGSPSAVAADLAADAERDAIDAAAVAETDALAMARADLAERDRRAAAERNRLADLGLPPGELWDRHVDRARRGRDR